MDENKRTRRSKEELLSEIDKKIASYKERITKLEEKKQRMINPPPRKKTVSSKKIIDLAKANGLSLEEIAEKLNIDIKNILNQILTINDKAICLEIDKNKIESKIDSLQIKNSTINQNDIIKSKSLIKDIDTQIQDKFIQLKSLDTQLKQFEKSNY